MSVEFLLLGGDRRQTELAKLLEGRFSVATIGVPGIRDGEAEHAKNLVLPIPTTKSDGALRGLAPEQLQPVLHRDLTVFGGLLGDWKDRLEASGIRCVDLLQDETVLVENARLTAEAALLLVMQQRQESLFEKDCCIVGFGRIGQLLSSRLRALGASVCVVSAKEEKRAMAMALGYEALAPEQLSSCEIVWNTAPLQLVPTDRLERLPERCLWVELASQPGGLPKDKSFRFAQLPAGGLPGKLLPVSAAEVLYRAILRHL